MEDPEAAQELLNADGVPLGLVYRDTSRPTFDGMAERTIESHKRKSVNSLLDQFSI